MKQRAPQALAEVLAVLAAEREITRVLHRYCHVVDRHDIQELPSVYHPDAGDEHSTHSGWGEARADGARAGRSVALPDPSQHTDGLRTREDLSYARG